MYVIQGNYGQGWEDLTSSDNLSEARDYYIDYVVNEPEYAHRIDVRGTDGSALS